MTQTGYIGVDGGGTKTHFTLIDSAENVLAEHVSGTTYHLQVGIDGVRTVLAQGFSALLGSARDQIDHIEHVFVGLPAYGEDSRIDPILQALPAEILGHSRYTCGNDMVCGWAGSLACADGINIVAGTGSIGYGMRCGVDARAGGWGELFSDEGSAYWVAIQGLNAFSRMSDRRLPRSALYDAFRKHLGLEQDIDLCSLTMGSSAMTRDQIAALSRVVTAAALGGDSRALEICEGAANELASIAHTIRRALGFDSEEKIPVSYSGGLFNAGPAVLTPFCETLLRLDPRYCVQAPQHKPSLGAALYAKSLSTKS